MSLDDVTPSMDATETSDPSDELRRLRLQVTQLTNVIKKLTGQQEEETESRLAKKAKSGRTFDPKLYKKRHVLLRVAYFGWDYHGFAVQETSGKTIESELFRALTRTRLIEDRKTANYHRCGRTDKGVSAFHQVISIDVRTNLLEGPGVFEQEGCIAHERKGNHDREIDYCKLLNSNLGRDIQVIAWAPCSNKDFSARFDCTERHYKYFFPRGVLNLDAINEAGEKLLGEHDFRNFCKLDVNNGVVNYKRRIDSVIASPLSCEDGAVSGPYDMCVLTIKGKAFLWHQIRCIVSVLFRVGEGKEEPQVVSELLDIEKNPCRPQYIMASEIPLNLFDCQYEDVEWQYEEESVEYVMRQFQSMWTEHQVKASMLRAALSSLERTPGVSAQVSSQIESLLPKTRTKTYTPLLDMLKCTSLEEKLAKSRKRKLAESSQ